MNLNNFTIKSQEAIQKAQEIAAGYQQQSIETTHILKGMLTVDEHVVPYLLKKLDVNVNNLTLALDKIISSYPKVANSEQYLSPNANQALNKAISYIKLFNKSIIIFSNLPHIVVSHPSVF